jgi:hypothetical protein
MLVCASVGIVSDLFGVLSGFNMGPRDEPDGASQVKARL